LVKMGKMGMMTPNPSMSMKMVMNKTNRGDFLM